jgi:hypothetical protein
MKFEDIGTFAGKLSAVICLRLLSRLPTPANIIDNSHQKTHDLTLLDVTALSMSIEIARGAMTLLKLFSFLKNQRIRGPIGNCCKNIECTSNVTDTQLTISTAVAHYEDSQIIYTT